MQFRHRLDPILKDAAWHFLVSRIVFLAAFVLGTILLPQPGGSAPMILDQPVSLPSPGALLGAVERSATAYGDFGWYEKLAREGYEHAPFPQTTATQRDWCFFPAQGWFTALVTQPLPRLILPLLLALTASLLTALHVSRNFGPSAARRTMKLMLYFPCSYELSQFRPENLLFLCFASALFLRDLPPRLAQYRKLAILPVLAAGFCKPNGFLIGIFWLPALLRALREHGRGRLDAAAMPAAAIGGIVVMSGWMYWLTGAPFAWARAQAAWGAALGATPLRQLQELFAHPMLIGRYGWDLTAFNWAVFLAALISAGLLLARRHFSAAAFLLATSLLSFANFGVWVQGKHLAPVFALFAGYAMHDTSETTLTGVIALLATLLALTGFLAAAGLHAVLA